MQSSSRGAYSASVIAEMRAWLADCEWRDITGDEIADLPAFVIERAVERHYDGGARQFRADCC